jgi:hypothetical protein
MEIEPGKMLSDGSSSHDEFNLDLDGKETVVADTTISSKRVDGNVFDIVGLGFRKSVLIPPPSSIIPQGYYWIDFHGPPRGNLTSEERDNDQDH